MVVLDNFQVTDLFENVKVMEVIHHPLIFIKEKLLGKSQPAVDCSLQYLALVAQFTAHINLLLESY